jgi:hypothetical protein
LHSHLFSDWPLAPVLCLASGHLHLFPVWPLTPVLSLGTRTAYQSGHSYMFSAGHLQLFSVWPLAPLFSPDLSLLISIRATRTCSHPGYWCRLLVLPLAPVLSLATSTGSQLATCTCSDHSRLFSVWPQLFLVLTDLNFSVWPSLTAIRKGAATCSQSGHLHLFSVWPLAPVLSLAISVTLNFPQSGPLSSALRKSAATCSQSGHLHLFSVWPLAPVLSLATYTCS